MCDDEPLVRVWSRKLSKDVWVMGSQAATRIFSGGVDLLECAAKGLRAGLNYDFAGFRVPLRGFIEEGG